MAKGQKKSSREAKKPKMKKEPVAATSGGLISRAIAAPPLPRKKG